LPTHARRVRDGSIRRFNVAGPGKVSLEGDVAPVKQKVVKAKKKQPAKKAAKKGVKQK
jgi:hypothetical protein